MPEKRKMEPEDEEIEPPPKCEKCGSDDVMPILHGLHGPDALEEFMKCEEEHRKPPLVLGGR
jgi:hypothetical protein